MAEPGKKEFTLWGFRIFILVLIILAALACASVFIFHDDKYKTPRFHEINWSPKEVISSLVENALADTNAIESQEEKEKQVSRLEKIKEWLSIKSDTAIRTEVYKNQSLIVHTRDLDVDSLSYNTKDKNEYVPLSPRFMVTYSDTGLLKGQVSDSVTLMIKRYPSLSRFINKYPGFGLWSLLLMMQTVLYFLFIAGFIFHFTSASANRFYTQHLGDSRSMISLISTGMLVFAFAVYLIIFYSKTSESGPGILFMRSLKRVFTMVNVAGYIAAAFCLAGMISSVIYMNRLKQLISSQTVSVELAHELRAEIKRRFNIYFVIAAIILSLAIFTSGVFFSSMNSMEFTKQVARDQGFSPVNHDLVYLYGILNSFMLVLAYLPARFMLSSLDRSIPSQTTDAAASPEKPDNKGALTGRLSKMMTNVTDVLVATSPFIASLLQNLIEYIFN